MTEQSKARVCGLLLAGNAVSNLAGAWTSICCESCVLSVGGLCDRLITRPEEYYRVCVCVSLNVIRFGNSVCTYSESVERRHNKKGRCDAACSNRSDLPFQRILLFPSSNTCDHWCEREVLSAFQNTEILFIRCIKRTYWPTRYHILNMLS
jgi:hypothetical protein